MDKIRKSMLAALTAMAVLLGFFAAVFPENTVKAAPERIAVYASLPQDWADPCIWAWSDDGTNAFAAWPGGEMEADDANEGWYYCWIPAQATNIIINANGGSVQTGDYKIEPANAWVTIEDAETVTVSYEAQTKGEIPEYVETFTVHAKVPESWEGAGLWAWAAPEGKNAFAAWPGKEMKAGEDGWYTAGAPVWVNSIIINGSGGSVQTEDLTIDPAEVWVTVAEDGTADFTYNDPDAPVAENITVHVKAPADWSGPCLWAWSAPDGTNAFSAWPGEALADSDEGWLTLEVPGWINSVIVNGNDGSVQTSDLSVEAGKDIWVVVTDAETVEVTYEQPAADPETDGADAEPEDGGAQQASGDEPGDADASDSREESDAQEEKSGGAGVWAAAGAACAAAVLGAGGFAYYKKKKQQGRPGER